MPCSRRVPLAEVPENAISLVPEGAVANTVEHSAAIPPAYAAYVADLANRFDLSPALLEAVVWQESRWREDAVSPAGARGLAQLMPGTARDLGVDPDDPLANLEGGARYLREQLDRFDGDLEKALAAYNAGPGRVDPFRRHSAHPRNTGLCRRDHGPPVRSFPEFRLTMHAFYRLAAAIAVLIAPSAA